MKTYYYKAILSTDTGKFNLHINARNKKVAKKMIMECEGCPESAILSIDRVANNNEFTKAWNN